VTGLTQQKLLLLTSLVPVSSTLVELIGSSAHSAEDICAIGWMEIPQKENTGGIFQTVHLCLGLLSAMHQLRPLLRLALAVDDYCITGDEQD